MRLSVIESAQAFKSKHQSIATIFRHCKWSDINSLLKLFMRTRCRILLLEKDDRVVAMCSIIDYEKCTFVGHLGVHNDFRGQGLARLLLNSRMTNSARSFDKPLLLVCREEHSSFYVNMGLQVQHRILRVELTPRSSCQAMPKLRRAAHQSEVLSVSSFDRKIFGSGRSRRIEATLMDPTSMLFFSTSDDKKTDGYTICENRRHGLHIGPVVCSVKDVTQILGGTLALMDQEPKGFFCDFYEESLYRNINAEFFDARVEQAFNLMSSTMEFPFHIHDSTQIHALWGRASG